MCVHEPRGALTLCVILSTLPAGCASNTAPSGWLSTANEAAGEAYGGWAEMAAEDGSRIDGELIAVDADSIHVLTENGLATIGVASVTSLKVTGYDPATRNLRAWSVFGTFSTVSHGWFLILSAPVWIITSSVATAAHSHVPQETNLPDVALDQLRLYARFPQGIPGELDRTVLKPRR